MKIYTDISMHNFDAWSGAKDTLETIKEHNKINDLEALIEEMFHGSTPTETDINDFLWFDDDFIFEHIGIEIE